MTDERLAEIEQLGKRECYSLPTPIRKELLAEIYALRAEVMEECRLNGMGAEREARLRGRIAELEAEVERLRVELGKRFLDSLAKREPAE